MLSCLQRMNDAKILRKFYTKYFRIYANLRTARPSGETGWDGPAPTERCETVDEMQNKICLKHNSNLFCK